jgi:hypothetical protein
MREAELLKALAQAPGGVQVNITSTGVCVSTRYTPLIRGRGITIMEAASNCAQKFIEAVEKNHDFGYRNSKVLKALDDYDRHSWMLQL